MGKQTPEEQAAAIERTAGLVHEERLGQWMDDQGLPGKGEPVTVNFISGGVDGNGLPSRDEMLHHYATVSGRSVDEIDYYVILARFKLAIVLEAGYARVVNGTADNPSMAAYEHVVLDNMRAAAELAATTKLGQ